jgi:hypothetical protein
MHIRLTVSLFAVLALLLGAACGGGSGEQATGAAPTGTGGGREPNRGMGPRSTGQAGPDLIRGLLRFEDMPANWQFNTWQLTPLTFPQFGDQTLAFREYFPANDVEAIVVYVRRGDRIMVLLDIAINARVDRLQTETLVGRAYERFTQLGGR